MRNRNPAGSETVPAAKRGEVLQVLRKGEKCGNRAQEQILSASDELAYFESVLEEISRASGEKDLNEIRYELIAGGYMKDRKRAAGKRQGRPNPCP
jgi:predicted ribosome quality control (RQC) complex YloA/Tae2 family protein